MSAVAESASSADVIGRPLAGSVHTCAIMPALRQREREREIIDYLLMTTAGHRGSLALTRSDTAWRLFSFASSASDVNKDLTFKDKDHGQGL